jgi:hypothetical protein
VKVVSDEGVKSTAQSVAWHYLETQAIYSPLLQCKSVASVAPSRLVETLGRSHFLSRHRIQNLMVPLEQSDTLISDGGV